jgi:predicted ester cyclase
VKKGHEGAYGAEDGLVDYILGITFEIWEQRRLELIHQYYGENTVVFGLDGITRGAATMVEGTRAMLDAFPDRLLLADDVIWSGTREGGFYSSHRIISPMTNSGPTQFGPATGKKVRILTIADCVVEDGVITQEWLLRDNHALVSQLGHDSLQAARIVAERRDAKSDEWIAAEIKRLIGAGVPGRRPNSVKPANSTEDFATQVLANNWVAGEQGSQDAAYAPYAVLHRSPIELYSGQDAIAAHYSHLRNAFDIAGLTIDHVAVQPADSEGLHLAVRWTAAGKHVGDYLGVAATMRPVFLLGSTHWRIENNRIAIEWTVFDGLGVLSQLV